MYNNTKCSWPVHEGILVSQAHSMTYRDAGVDIDAGDALVERIKPLVARRDGRKFWRASAALAPSWSCRARYRRPVLVSGTDGVGTKLRLAIERAPRHDRYRSGRHVRQRRGRPGRRTVFFSTTTPPGKLDVEVAEGDRRHRRGLCAGRRGTGRWRDRGNARHLYGQDYDLAGFCVGVVEKDAIIDSARVRPGDAVIGLASSGPHSNGYSLIRKLIALAHVTAATELEGRPLSSNCLRPLEFMSNLCWL